MTPPVAPSTASTPPTVPAPPSEVSEADFDAEWAWIRAEFPEASEYRPVSNDAALLATLVAWVPPGETATVYDRACRPIVLRRAEGDGSLIGRVHEQTRTSGRRVVRSYEEVVFDGAIMVTCGANRELFTRAPDGTLTRTSSSGYGCARRVGHSLSRVTEDAAWYDGARVQLAIRCAHRLETSQTCQTGGRRTCERCSAWGVQAASLEPNVGFGVHVPVTRNATSDAVDCTAACPADDPPANVVRARRAVEGRGFVRDVGDEAPPYLFRTRRACRAYQRAHRVSAGERETW